MKKPDEVPVSAAAPKKTEAAAPVEAKPVASAPSKVTKENELSRKQIKTQEWIKSLEAKKKEALLNQEQQQQSQEEERKNEAATAEGGAGASTNEEPSS